MTITPRLETVALEDLFADSSFIASWRELAAGTPGTSYFQTPDWIVTWWETIAGRPGGMGAVVWQNGSLAGFLPLARTREPIAGRLPIRFPFLTNAGTGIGADHAGWIARPTAVETLARWTAEQNVLLRGIPVDVGEALGGRMIESHACPRVAIDEVDEKMSSKLAKTLRNARRRLADQEVSFDWKPPGTVTSEDLQALYSLHADRRGDAGDESVFSDPARRAFHDGLLEASVADDGGTAAMVATKDGEVIGVLYGFVWRDTFSYYQIGWNPDFRRLSLGSVLVIETIEACAAAGISMFDFLRGAETYKYRFGATDVNEGSFVVGRTLSLEAMAAVSRVRRRLSDEEG